MYMGGQPYDSYDGSYYKLPRGDVGVTINYTFPEGRFDQRPTIECYYDGEIKDMTVRHEISFGYVQDGKHGRVVTGMEGEGHHHCYKCEDRHMAKKKKWAQVFKSLNSKKNQFSLVNVLRQQNRLLVKRVKALQTKVKNLCANLDRVERDTEGSLYRLEDFMFSE